ncbi:MAG: ComF family protein [Spirochaetales bacterium]|nr:ComF family protein [Spirochaetales bacterium]
MRTFYKRQICLWDSILRLVFPEICLICGVPIQTKEIVGLCETCRSRIKRWEGRGCTRCGKPLISEDGICSVCREKEYLFDSGYSLFDYRSEGRELIYQYKFKNRRILSKYFAYQIVQYMLDRGEILPVIPVPPRRKSIKRRGWDPVNRILRDLERNYSIKGLRPLKRLDSRAQKELNREKREQNLKNRIVFLNKINFDFSGGIYLLDDVWTTGATVNECSRILKQNGFQSIHVITICRD